MLMVNADSVVVESQIDNGEFCCPSDGAVLRKWGWARPRRVRGLNEQVVPRKLHCPVCKTTQVLLPETLLLRKGCSTELVGQMLELAARGLGFRPIARRFAVPESTVRRLLRTVRGNVRAVVALLAVQVRQFDPLAPSGKASAGGSAGALVAAVGSLVEAVRIRFPDKVGVAPWLSLSKASMGRFASVGFSP